MSENWSEEVLLAQIAEALEAADAIPHDFVEAGKATFAWRTIDSELAELAFDSDLQDHQDLIRSEPAPLRALTFTAPRAAVTIEIEVVDGALLGQLVPEQAGEIHIVTRTGHDTSAVIDEVGYFLISPMPVAPFRIHCQTASGVNMSTNWITL
ncbi:hypothetical protein J5X84_43515 [Streptosporangiaceae bacterium NEAU-GS5]|nr:hypothetical protein [Streptosporangiaceae bacterium NEAU-GS5]